MRRVCPQISRMTADWEFGYDDHLTPALSPNSRWRRGGGLGAGLIGGRHCNSSCNGFSKRRRMVFPLLEERAGVRTVVEQTLPPQMTCALETECV